MANIRIGGYLYGEFIVCYSFIKR